MTKHALLPLIFGICLLIFSPSPAGAIPGDVNGDTKIDIADAILALQIMNLSPQTADIKADVNQDSRIGMAEVLYILQGVAGQRTFPSIFEIKAANGRITLPAGVPVALTDLTILNPAGEAHPDAQGAFAVDTLDGGASLTTVLSPAGNVMLLGWLDADHQSISPRTTAEVMLFFALGADRYSTDDRDRLRWLLTSAPEVTPLEMAISSELTANADAFAGENASVVNALTSVMDTLSASGAAGSNLAAAGTGRQLLSVSVEPSETKSGITILPEGVNKIRFSNEYRRRVRVWIDQIAYVPSGGGAWVPAKLPLTEFEIDPVNGLKSVMGTVTDYIAGLYASGKSAYTPKSSEPVSLPVMPKSAEKTAYEIIACGNGFFDGDIASLPADRMAGYGKTAVNFIFFDIIMPAIVNIIAPQTKVPEILKKHSVEDPDAAMFLKLIQSSPALWEKLSTGDIHGATTSIRSMMIDTYKKGILKDLLKGMITISGQTPAQALRAGAILDGFLNSMKVMNAALTAVDIKVIEAHGYLSNKMETWRVEVGHPKVVLTPEQAIVIPGGTQAFTATLPEAAGDGAPALTYHWKSSNTYGSLTDDIHTGAEFDSSKDKTTYTGASLGTDTVEVEAFEVQGQGRVSVGTGTSTVEVASARVSINKAPLVDLQQGKNVTLKAILEPTPTIDQNIWYEWTSACAFGKFNGGNPFRDKSSQLQYMADPSSEGEDVVTVTAYRVLGDWWTGTRTALAQAQTRVRVWAVPKQAPVSFHTYGPLIMFHPYQAPGDTKPHNKWIVYGWAWSWPTPEGMHQSNWIVDGSVANGPRTAMPTQIRFDDAYTKGLDVMGAMGVPKGDNYQNRVGMEKIYDSDTLTQTQERLTHLINMLGNARSNWNAQFKVNCYP